MHSLSPCFGVGKSKEPALLVDVALPNPSSSRDSPHPPRRTSGFLAHKVICKGCRGYRIGRSFVPCGLGGLQGVKYHYSHDSMAGRGRRFARTRKIGSKPLIEVTLSFTRSAAIRQ